MVGFVTKIILIHWDGIEPCVLFQLHLNLEEEYAAMIFKPAVEQSHPPQADRLCVPVRRMLCQLFLDPTCTDYLHVPLPIIIIILVIYSKLRVAAHFYHVYQSQKQYYQSTLWLY